MMDLSVIYQILWVQQDQRVLQDLWNPSETHLEGSLGPLGPMFQFPLISLPADFPFP